jgi:hypothetical protein
LKSVTLIDFDPSHVQAMEDIEGELQYLGDDLIDNLTRTEEAGPGYTGVFQDKVIGCGGVRLFWDGVGEAWGIYPPNFYDNIREVFYYTKTMMNRIIDENSLKRVQATARVDYPGAQNWLRHLGFSIECKMKNYCPSGQDTFLYSLLRN